MRRSDLSVRGVVLTLSLASLGFTASCQSLPEAKVPREKVLAAAKEVIAQRYPMSRVEEADGQIMARSAVTVDGSSRTMKQVSVVVKQNYTGAYEPVVSVRKNVQFDVEPSGLSVDPDAANPALAKPIAMPVWKFLDTLPYEEQEIYDAIWKKLAPPAM